VNSLRLRYSIAILAIVALTGGLGLGGGIFSPAVQKVPVISSLASWLGPGVAEAVEAAAVEEEEAAAKGGDSNTPYKVFAAALAVGLCAVATAFAQSKIGTAGMGAIAEKPEVAPMCIVLLAIPETLVILGFVVAAMAIMF